MPVFKYVSSKGFNEIFGKKPTLLYRRIDKLNDPYENLIGIEEYARKIFDLIKSGEYLESLNKSFDLVSALSVGRYQTLTEDEICENLKKSFYVLSLSRSYQNLLMWAHYADMHKGVVIEFDENSPVFIEDKISFIDSLSCVSYSEDRKPIDFIMPQNYPELVSSLGKTAIKLLKFKSEDWKYEDEKRQVLIDTRPMNKLFFGEEKFINDAPDLVYCNKLNAFLRKVDFEIVNNIYLGVNFDTEDMSNQLTIKRLQEKEIPIYKMSLQKDQYSLRPEKYVE